MAAGDEQPPIQPGTGAALEEVAQGAALQAGKALLEHLALIATHRKTISQPICRPNVHKLEVTLTKAEKLFSAAIKLYNEAQNAHSCARQDVEILAQAMRLHQQEPHEDESVRDKVNISLAKLKTESENLMSGVVEPAAFVIRTGMTSRDIHGANKEDWICYSHSGHLIDNTWFRKLIPMLSKAIICQMHEMELTADFAEMSNWPLRAPSQQATAALATASLQQPPPPQQLVPKPIVKGTAQLMRETMKDMTAIFRKYANENQMGAHMCSVNFHEQCVVPDGEPGAHPAAADEPGANGDPAADGEPGADGDPAAADEPAADGEPGTAAAAHSSVARWDGIDTKFVCKHTRAAINALNDPTADDVQMLLKSHCLNMREHLQDFLPDLPMVSWTSGRKIKSDQVKKICEALLTLDLCQSNNTALRQCWDEYNQK